MQGERMPTVSIAPASVLEGDSGFADLAFTVTLSEASDQTVIVSGTASGLTAASGDDFTQTIAPLTFLPGETSKLFIVPVHGDALIEDDETLQIELGNPVNAELGETFTAIGTIVDDDSLPAIVSIASLGIAEGDSGTTTAVFTISLSLPSPQDVTVAVSTSSGTATEGVDFERFNEIVTIPGGETSATIEVLVNGDIADPRWVPWVGALLIVLPVLLTLPFNRPLAFFLALGAFIYVGIYTIWLKPRTLLNIVIGGAAGSAAVLSGSAAAGYWNAPGALALAAILFLWTPIHFWSLAILYRDEYARADVPMLPTQTTPRKAASIWALCA